MDRREFIEQVGVAVKEDYGLDDGADLCYNLIDMGVIDQSNETVEPAARRVAQHMLEP